MCREFFSLDLQLLVFGLRRGYINVEILSINLLNQAYFISKLLLTSKIQQIGNHQINQIQFYLQMQQEKVQNKDWQIIKADQKFCLKLINTSDQSKYLGVKQHQDKIQSTELMLLDQKPQITCSINNQLGQIIINTNDTELIYKLQTNDSLNLDKQQTNLIDLFTEQTHISQQQYFNLKKNQRHYKQILLQKHNQNKKLKNQIQRLKQLINPLNNQNQIKIKIPDPVLYAPIEFYDNQKLIRYTDCWQISVLRFLHLVFGQNGTINQNKLTKFMDLSNKNCLKLIGYFKQNPKYQFQEQFYKTSEGFKIRSQWAQFLNNSKLFKVKLQNKYQVIATVPNIIAFFKGFFPKIKMSHLQNMTFLNVLTRQLFQNYQIVLSKIYQQLSQAAQFQLKLKIIQKFEYQDDYIFFSSIQQIYVNEQIENDNHLLEWQIYEYYEINDKKKILGRMMGHSDYRYNKNLIKQKQMDCQLEEYQKQLINMKIKISEGKQQKKEEKQSHELKQDQN